MQAYSQDFRQRVLRLCDQGHGTSQVAHWLAVSPAWVRRLKQRRREEGVAVPKTRPWGGDRRSWFDAAAQSKLRAIVEAEPDLTLEQLQRRCRSALGIDCSIMSLSRTLRKMNLSFKKRR